MPAPEFTDLAPGQIATASNTAAGLTALSRRPDAVPPGPLSRVVYLCYAMVGLGFAIYNAALIVRQMAASHEDPGFASATLFYCMGMLPTVFALYLTAGIKTALIEKLGAKPIFIMGGLLVLFCLLLWAVLGVSQADRHATLIGFFIPMIVRVTFQNPAETANEANQRILIYFAGMFLGLGLGWVLGRFTKVDMSTHDDTFYAFSSVVLVSQLLQVWHGSLQTVSIFKWERRRAPGNSMAVGR